jgi:hypothetical protein
MTRDSVRRAVRTFVITTLALAVPGLLGWLNALTQWARDEGSTPFPDARGLAFVFVSAIVAGVVAVVNGVWNAVEDATGRGMLRDVPPRQPRPGQRGAVSLVGALVVLGVVLILADLIFVQVGFGVGAGVLCLVAALLLHLFGGGGGRRAA